MKVHGRKTVCGHCGPGHTCFDKADLAIWAWKPNTGKLILFSAPRTVFPPASMELSIDKKPLLLRPWIGKEGSGRGRELNCVIVIHQTKRAVNHSCLVLFCFGEFTVRVRMS